MILYIWDYIDYERLERRSICRQLIMRDVVIYT